MTEHENMLTEISFLKCELGAKAEALQKAELEKEHYMKRIDELENERQFLLGQNQAFKFMIERW